MTSPITHCARSLPPLPRKPLREPPGYSGTPGYDPTLRGAFFTRHKARNTHDRFDRERTIARFNYHALDTIADNAFWTGRDEGLNRTKVCYGGLMAAASPLYYANCRGRVCRPDLGSFSPRTLQGADENFSNRFQIALHDENTLAHGEKKCRSVPAKSFSIKQ